MNRAPTASESREGQSFDNIVENVNAIHLSLRGSSQKAEAWRFGENETLKFLVPIWKHCQRTNGSGHWGPLLRLVCRSSSKARQRAPPQALRVVNDGAVGSRTGNRWEAQVHEVSLLPGTERHTEQSGLRVLMCRDSGPSQTHLIQQGNEHKVHSPPDRPLPAKFLSFVSSWDLCHATLGHLTRKLLLTIWCDDSCVSYILNWVHWKLTFLNSQVPTVQSTGHSLRLNFNKEGIPKGFRQIYLNVDTFLFSFSLNSFTSLLYPETSQNLTPSKTSKASP